MSWYHLTWTLNWWGIASWAIWSINAADSSLCRPHAMMVSGGFIGLFALGIGDGLTLLLCAAQFATGWLWWYMGGGCGPNKRWKRLLAALGSLAGELRKAAMARTMRERRVPVPVPAWSS